MSDELVGGSLVLFRVPTCEDVREFVFPSLSTFENNNNNKKNELIKKQVAMSTFVDSMTLSDPVNNNNNCNPLLLEVLTHIHNKLTNVKSNKNNKDVLRIKNPLESPVECPVVVVASLRNEFPLVKLDPKQTKRKVVWSDIYEDENNNNNNDKKRGGFDLSSTFLANNANLLSDNNNNNNNESKSSEPPSLPPFTLGSVDPDKDFLAVTQVLINNQQ